METILENQNEDEIRQRRDFMKKFGKESRHNVISRKDNLVLSPDQPPRIEEGNEVCHTVLWQLYIENQKHPPNFWMYDVFLLDKQLSIWRIAQNQCPFL